MENQNTAEFLSCTPSSNSPRPTFPSSPTHPAPPISFPVHEYFLYPPLSAAIMPKALSDELLKKLPLKSILKNREPGPISPEYYAKHHPTSSVPTSNAETSKRRIPGALNSRENRIAINDIRDSRPPRNNELIDVESINKWVRYRGSSSRRKEHRHTQETQDSSSGTPKRRTKRRSAPYSADPSTSTLRRTTRSQTAALKTQSSNRARTASGIRTTRDTSSVDDLVAGLGAVAINGQPLDNSTPSSNPSTTANPSATRKPLVKPTEDDEATKLAPIRIDRTSMSKDVITERSRLPPSRDVSATKDPRPRPSSPSREASPVVASDRTNSAEVESDSAREVQPSPIASTSHGIAKLVTTERVRTLTPPPHADVEGKTSAMMVDASDPFEMQTSPTVFLPVQDPPKSPLIRSAVAAPIQLPSLTVPMPLSQAAFPSAPLDSEPHSAPQKSSSSSAPSFLPPAAAGSWTPFSEGKEESVVIPDNGGSSMFTPPTTSGRPAANYHSPWKLSTNDLPALAVEPTLSISEISLEGWLARPAPEVNLTPPPPAPSVQPATSGFSWLDYAESLRVESVRLQASSWIAPPSVEAWIPIDVAPSNLDIPDSSSDDFYKMLRSYGSRKAHTTDHSTASSTSPHRGVLYTSIECCNDGRIPSSGVVQTPRATCAPYSREATLKMFSKSMTAEDDASSRYIKTIVDDPILLRLAGLEPLSLSTALSSSRTSTYCEAFSHDNIPSSVDRRTSSINTTWYPPIPTSTPAAAQELSHESPVWRHLEPSPTIQLPNDDENSLNAQDSSPSSSDYLFDDDEMFAIFESFTVAPEEISNDHHRMGWGNTALTVGSVCGRAVGAIISYLW